MRVSLISCYSLEKKQSAEDARFRFGNKTNLLLSAKVANPSFESTSLTSLRGIHCPCCGLLMVTMEDFSKILIEQNLSGSSKKALESVAKFSASMHHVEKRVFHILEKLSKENPGATLAQLLVQEAPKHFKNLQIRQLRVLDEIDIYSIALPEDIKAKLSVLSSTARAQILSVADSNNINSKYFKRKMFVNPVRELMEANSDNPILKKIYAAAEKLPNSTNDVDSFVIKYFRRSSREIGQRLVSPSLSTVEHILPVAKDGENDIRNYLPECAYCNGERHDTFLHKWIQKNPKMLKNILVTAKEVFSKLKRIKNKIYVEQNYPKIVVQRIEEQTIGNARGDKTIPAELMKKFQLLSRQLRKLVQDYSN